MPRVFPVPGFWLNGVPAEPHDCDDAFCVDSGAFTTRKPPPIAADQDTDDPADAGSLDSPEV